MRKISAYARKIRRSGNNGFNGSEWLNTIQKCQSYSDEPPVGSWLQEGTATIVTTVLARVHSAFRSMVDGCTPPDNTEDFDLMAHALGVADIRSLQIAGDVDNPMRPDIKAASDALLAVRARRVKWGKWEVIKAEELAIDAGIAIYETILEASSPGQMAKASEMRAQILRGKTYPL